MSNKLIILGCSHIGHKHADLSKLERYLSLKDCDFIDIGDTFEAGVPDKKAKSMEQNLTLDEQYHLALDMYKDTKVLAKCTSNHSNRVWESLGFDFDKAFCHDLEIPYYDFRGQIRWNGLRVAFHHGYGSGSNTWSDAKQLLSVFPDSDVILVSHKHEMEYKKFYNYINGKKHLVHFVRTGSLMDDARYARMSNYLPSFPGFSILEIKDDTLYVNNSGDI